MSTSKSSGPSLGKRAVAVLVLLLAAWVIFQVVKGVVVALFWTVAAILAVIAVLWAIFTLRRS